MAERKYRGTDAELLRMKREGLSLRAIAAKVGIGKSVVGTRIARAEAAERAQAESPAATDSMSRPAAPSSSAPSVAGAIDVRAQVEAIAQDPQAGYRERLGALQTLAKLDKVAGGPQSDQIRPRRIGTLAVEPQRREDGTLRYRLWLRERVGWTSSIDGLSPRQAWALLGCMLLADELGDDFVVQLRAGMPTGESTNEEPKPELRNHEEPERPPKALRSEPTIR